MPAGLADGPAGSWGDGGPALAQHRSGVADAGPALGQRWPPISDVPQQTINAVESSAVGKRAKTAPVAVADYKPLRAASFNK